MLTLIFGQDHPAGKWADRHNIPAAGLSAEDDLDSSSPREPEDEDDLEKEKRRERKRKEQVSVHVVEAEQPPIESVVDVAVNEALTWKTAWVIIKNPLTWLPTLAYITTFGFELALDAKMADVLYSMYKGQLQGFNQQTAGYYTSILYVIRIPSSFAPSTDKNISGFLNLVTRPFGGYVGDVVYRRWGTQGKKWWTIACGLIMGVSTIAGGFYIAGHKTGSLPDREFLLDFAFPTLTHSNLFLKSLS